MSRHLERARLLFQQHRPELAESELRRALAESPNDPEPHSLLALCLVRREQWDEATQEAQLGIHLAPDESYGHYALACVLSRRKRPAEAVEAIEEAIRIDPFDADYFALLAGLHCEQVRWNDGLAAAEQGLAIRPDHVQCTNARAIALVKLGRRDEAGRTIDAALARAPEDATSHANMGWTLLERREPQKAMEHFREALRLNPQLEWARAGIVESMKARHFVYRWMLTFFLWMSRFDSRTQWMLMIGFILGRSILANIAKSVPILEPLYWPIVIGYLLFAILTWIASPLFNLILRLDRFGRLALSRKQVVESNLLGLCLLAGLLVATVPTAWQYYSNPPVDGDWAACGILFLGLALPVTNIFRCDRGWPRAIQMSIASGLAVAVVGATVTCGFDWPTGSDWFSAAAWGLVLSTWSGVFLAQATVRH